MSVERWKRKLRRLGFEGSVSAWPDSFGSDLSVEAVAEDRGLKSVQRVFKVGPDDNRTAKELLRDFSASLKSVYEQCQEQVLDASDVREAHKAIQAGNYILLKQVKQDLGL